MAVKLLDMLKASKAFGDLNDHALEDIISKFEKVYLHKEQKLFVQGEFTDGFFFLLTGKLVTTLKRHKSPQQFVATVHPGETVGEMGAFSLEPRTTTVKALEDSLVLKLSNDNFRKICKAYPPLVLYAMDTLAKRSHNIIDALNEEKEKRRQVCILPADDTTSIEEFAQNLQAELQSHPEVVLLSDYDRDFTKKYADEGALTKYFETLKQKEKTVISLLSSYETPLSKVALESMDLLYILGEGPKKPQLTGFVRDKIKEFLYKTRPILLLTHKCKKPLPKNTYQWLKLADFQLHHHLRLNHEVDIQRLLRFMRGKAIGLVLGGGGIRSWAHMGVIKAMKELKIPIDFIGGTSAGALVGGYYALHETYADPKDELQKLSIATTQTFSFRSLTWPAISVTDSKQYTLCLQNIFKNFRIENLWVPFFCVSCKLETNAAVIQRRGLLWEKIRSSTSIPGVFPPMVLKGKIFLDGGIVNNLPVDLMKKIAPGIGTLIAVELLHEPPSEKVYHFPPILPFWKVVLAKLHLAYRDYKFPHFIDTFLSSLLAGSTAKQRETAAYADILIQPDLSDFHLLNITRAEELKLVELGYTTALKLFKKKKIDF